MVFIMGEKTIKPSTIAPNERGAVSPQSVIVKPKPQGGAVTPTSTLKPPPKTDNK